MSIRRILLPLFALPVPLLLLTAAPAGNAPPSYSRIGGPTFEYNYQTKETLFQGSRGNQAWILHKDYRINANRIFWNRETEIGRCFDDVRIVDITNDIIITGGSAWHYSKEGRSLVRQNPVLLFRKNNVRIEAEEMVRTAVDKTARAMRNVVITSKDGVARGDMAIYDLKAKTITLTGDPVLEQKSNTHRAEKMVFHDRENKVILEGRAFLGQGDDRIHADRIVLLDKEPRKKKRPRGAPPDSGDDKKRPKDREAYFYGNVRIYHYRKNGKLDSITTGGYGEYFQKTDYARMLQDPRMIMAGDNTIVRGAVMEQFRKEDLAVVKGNVSIVKQYRTISGQLARYLIKDKKIILTGSPVITEYGDSYRADHVIFDTDKDTVSWTGESRAVIGVEDQIKKAAQWASRFGITGSQGGALARLRGVIGEIFISASDTPRTNQGQVVWGKLAAVGDTLASGNYLIQKQGYGWCDFSSGSSLGRLSGQALLQFLPLAASPRAKLTNASPPGRSVLLPTGLGKPSRIQPASGAGTTPGGGPAAGRHSAGTNAPGRPSPATNTLPPPASALYLLREGSLYISPGAGRQALSFPFVTVTNLARPALASADLFAGRLILFTRAMDRPPASRTNRSLVRRDGPGDKKTDPPLLLQLSFPSLAGFTFSGTNAGPLFLSNIRPQLEVPVAPGMLVALDFEKAEQIEARLAIFLSNQRLLRPAMTNTAPPEKGTAGQGNTADKQQPALAYSGDLMSGVLAILGAAKAIVSVAPLPGPGSRVQEELEQMRTFLYPVPAAATGPAKTNTAPRGRVSGTKQSGKGRSR